jgi:hypothetical protein
MKAHAVVCELMVPVVVCMLGVAAWVRFLVRTWSSRLVTQQPGIDGGCAHISVAMSHRVWMWVQGSARNPLFRDRVMYGIAVTGVCHKNHSLWGELLSGASG